MLPEYKLIIAGGRDFNDAPLMRSELNTLLLWRLVGNRVVIVSGMARGADELGLRLAEKRGLESIGFRANWKAHGRAAGPIRNQKMADCADGLLAFWDGRSRGTKDMIRRMERMGKFVKVVRYPTTDTPHTDPPLP